MPQDAIQVLAGDCTVRYEGEETREERGAVVALAKPDNTVLVHDRDGYRPTAWITRADTVSYRRDGDGIVLEAAGDGCRLRVECHAEYGGGHYFASRAGEHVGACPDCGEPLIHADGAVACLGCDARYAVSRDATVLADRCDACGLPRMGVERGEAFELCVDRDCESLDDAVRERFDRAWDCPACGGDLRVLRRGGLIAGCEAYPDCETGFAIPSGTVDGSCAECGLPAFETGSGRRCLDAACAGP